MIGNCLYLKKTHKGRPMINRMLGLTLGFCLSGSLQAFPCFITMVKDQCWTNYELTIDVIKGRGGAKITTIVVPIGKSWVREKFDCQPKGTISLTATYSPVFWARDKGKVYRALHDWVLPDKIEKGDTAWNINVCFAEMFAEVPLPPEANGTCACEWKDIPAVEPQ